MKKLLLIFAFLASPALAEDLPRYEWKVLRVIDGDTVEIEAPYLPKPLKPKLSIRVYGVDTPEKSFRAQCPEEAALGQAASEFTKKLVANATMTMVEIREWDKYGGRVLGDVWLDGRSLTAMLIENGYAREYYGNKKESWCK